MTTRRASIGPSALIGRPAHGCAAPRASAASPRRAVPPAQGAAPAPPRRRLPARALHQAIERQIEQVAAAAVVHHDLAGRGEHLLHGLYVDAFARHRGRLGVLGEHLAEARGIALGARDHALAVAVGLLLQARGGAARARDHVVGVGLALVLLALAVLAGFHRIVEGRLHLLGRLRVLDRHRAHLDAGAVAVVDRLHEVARLVGDVNLRLAQDLVHRALADHLAHRGLGDLHRRLVGPAHVEGEIARVLHYVLHRELQVDDVLVVGEHQRLFEHLGAHVVAVAHLQRAHLGEVDDLLRLDRPRQAPAQAGAGFLREAAEGEHDAALALDHDVEAAREPHQHDERDEHARAAADLPRRRRLRRLVAAAAPAAEELAEAPVEVAPQLVQVGRALVAAARALRPAGAAAPVGVVQ
jgi:hypothetical protein